MVDLKAWVPVVGEEGRGFNLAIVKLGRAWARRK